LIVVDVKDGENCFASLEHRKAALGTKCIVLDPFGISGHGNVCINPLQRLMDIVRRGEEIDTQADEIAQILIPANPKDSENSWVRKGALRLLATRMEYLARYQPELCNLPGLWRFVNSSREDLDRAFAMMKTCGTEGIEQRAHSLHATMEDAERQWEAYKSDCIEAVAPFEPGKTFARATEQNEFSFGALKHEKHTVYIVVPSEKIGVAAPWISLIINHAIEEIAKETGPLRTTFLLDEFPQLPPAPAIMKALRLYRGKNIQLWFFAQGRYSMRARWSEDSVKEFEDQAAIMTFGFVQDPDLVRDISAWSGTASVLMKNKGYSGGTVESANAGLSEVKREVLQPEDVYRASIDGRQIIKVRSLPYLLVADVVPYYVCNPWQFQIRDVRDLHNGNAAQ
jgi:type IV secretion system protein VirD4